MQETVVAVEYSEWMDRLNRVDINYSLNIKLLLSLRVQMNPVKMFDKFTDESLCDNVLKYTTST